LTATAERRPPAWLVEVCFTIAPCWKPALRGRCASGSLNSSAKAKNVLRLAISFLNSALTLRGVPINCRFGFTKLYHLETD
jgi:hypothetical protein